MSEMDVMFESVTTGWKNKARWSLVIHKVQRRRRTKKDALRREMASKQGLLRGVSFAIEGRYNLKSKV